MTNTASLDIQLIGQGGESKDPPGSPVITGFGFKQGPAFSKNSIKFLEGFH
jgi:hypothetical protein